MMMGAAALSRHSARLDGTRRRRPGDQGANHKPPPKFPHQKGLSPSWGAVCAPARARLARSAAACARGRVATPTGWAGSPPSRSRPASAPRSSSTWRPVVTTNGASRAPTSTGRCLFRCRPSQQNFRSVKPPLSPDRARCRQTRATHGACRLAWAPPAMRAPATCRLPARCSCSSRARARRGRPRSAPSARSTWCRGPSTASSTSPTRGSSTRSVRRQSRSLISRSDGGQGQSSRRAE